MTPIPQIPPSLYNLHPELRQWVILHAYRGSVAHGMYVPNDDPNSIDDIDMDTATAACWRPTGTL